MGETVCTCVPVALQSWFKRRTDLLLVCSLSVNISKVTDVLGMYSIYILYSLYVFKNAVCLCVIELTF